MTSCKPIFFYSHWFTHEQYFSFHFIATHPTDSYIHTCLCNYLKEVWGAGSKGRGRGKREEGRGKRVGPGRETSQRWGRQGWEAEVEGRGRWKGRGLGGRVKGGGGRWWRDMEREGPGRESKGRWRQG